MGSLLEVREDRGTIESIHKCVLYYLCCKFYSNSISVSQKLIRSGPVVHWRIREWDSSRRLEHWNFIPRTLHRVEGEGRTWKGVLIWNAL